MERVPTSKSVGYSWVGEASASISPGPEENGRMSCGEPRACLGCCADDFGHMAARVKGKHAV